MERDWVEEGQEISTAEELREYVSLVRRDVNWINTGLVRAAAGVLTGRPWISAAEGERMPYDITPDPPSVTEQRHAGAPRWWRADAERPHGPVPQRGSRRPPPATAAGRVCSRWRVRDGGSTAAGHVPGPPVGSAAPAAPLPSPPARLRCPHGPAVGDGAAM